MKLKYYLLAIILVLSFNKLRSQTIDVTSFNSSSLGNQQIPVEVYLPQNYDTIGNPFNLYIFLHGCCAVTNEFFTSDFAPVLDSLIANNIIDPMVVVFPSVIGADFGNRHMWYNSVRNGQYADLITVDLLNWLGTHYNISQTNRAIGGFSMGGDGAIRIGLNNTDKFVAMVAHSSFPALDFFQDVIPYVLSETGQSAPPYTYTPVSGSVTEMVYGLSSAWSPNLSNLNYQLDFPLDQNGNLITSVFSQWKYNADVDSIIRHNWAGILNVPIPMYYDIGVDDDLYQSNVLLDTELNNLIQNENYTINYKYLEFSGDHVLTSDKIDSSLIWLNNIFQNTMSITEEITPDDYNIIAVPNPTYNYVKLLYKGQDIPPGYSLMVIDINGQVVQNYTAETFEKMDYNIDMTGLTSGVYQLILMNENINHIVKLGVIKL